MPSNQSGINDDELNRMIANLQQGQRSVGSTPTSTISPANTTGGNVIPGEKVVRPPAQVGGTNNPVSNLFNQPASNDTKIDPAKPINLSDAGDNNQISGNMTANGGSAPSDLEEIRHQAIVELRPLVDKLNLPPEDKFDTLLLLIRTTDDSSLIPAAHTAAMSIADDTRRAQALLDVIKEIDFFGRK